MKPFLGDDFLLDTDTAHRLYHEHAAPQGIIDYHCHLPPAELAQNRRFDNLAQIWLEGDHYKWRAMRAAGIPEHLITGAAGDREKYDAWARTVPQTLGNPLYIWTHLELQRPFGIRGLLFGPGTAAEIWERTADLLAQDDFSARGIVRQMNVRMIGTTDDPVDDLVHHESLARSDFPVRVLPSFRPDRAFKIEWHGFKGYIEELGEACDIHIGTLEDLFRALGKRMDHFAAHGCCSADHGIENVRYDGDASPEELDRILGQALSGRAPDAGAAAKFSTAVLLYLGREYARRDWVMQYHIGAQRDNNARRLRELGPNTGFDSIGDQPYAQPLAALLSALDEQDRLPRTILYGINPASNDMLATMTGNFQGGETGCKVQFGSAWWLNDQHDGMLRQLTALAQHSLLSRFVGMLTDSRSFLSYTRHEYFRRILCALLGRWVENGELPDEPELLGGMVEDICFNNANRYFKLNL